MFGLALTLELSGGGAVRLDDWLGLEYRNGNKHNPENDQKQRQ